MPQRARTVVFISFMGPLVGCSGDEPDPHGHADVKDVAAPLDRLTDDAASLDAPTGGDATAENLPGDVRGGDGAVCSPACGTGQVCCTDQHGHFPTCRAGSACPDAGGEQ